MILKIGMAHRVSLILAKPVIYPASIVKMSTIVISKINSSLS